MLRSSLQVKLLRFLQERIIERIGGRKAIPLDVRVVCATHRNLSNMISEQTFRDDLFYRLGEVTVNIPLLAERTGDAILLAKHFVSKFAREMNPTIKGMSTGALAAIDAWNWPGNVRELENVLQRAVILSDGPLITPTDLPPGLAPAIGEFVLIDGLDEAVKRFEKTHIELILNQNNHY